MRYRKLRITWTAICAIACLLLLVLWVRSYWDYFVISLPGTDRWLGSANGSINLNYWGGVSDSVLRTQLAIPYWLSVLLFATLTAIPWIRRFNLRTLLLAITAVAVVLGLVVAALRWPAG